MKGSSMKAFRRLCRVTALRTLRDPVTVVFSLAFAPVFIIVMGLIFGNDPPPPSPESKASRSARKSARAGAGGALDDARASARTAQRSGPVQDRPAAGSGPAQSVDFPASAAIVAFT